MPITIKRTGSKDYGRFMKVLICGDPGAGKTLISSTFPSPIYASAEGGLMSIADRAIPYTEIRSSDDLLSLKNAVDQPADVREKLLGFQVDTVVIDTIDEIQKILVRERLHETKKDSMSLPDWGWLGEQMQAIVRGFRNLDLNVVFTCHLRETKDDESGRVVYEPGLQGAFGKQIAGYVDLALVLKAHQSTKIVEGEAQRVTLRYLQAAPDLAHPWVKDRSGKLPMEFEVNFENDHKRLEALVFAGADQLEEGDEFEIGESTIVDPVEVSTPAPTPPVKAKPKPQVKADLPQPPVNQTVDSPAAEENDRSSDQAAVEAEVAAENAAVAMVQEAIPEAVVELPDCVSCGNKVESIDQADLSRIRFREILCKTCHTARKR